MSINKISLLLLIPLLSMPISNTVASEKRKVPHETVQGLDDDDDDIFISPNINDNTIVEVRFESASLKVNKKTLANIFPVALGSTRYNENSVVDLTNGLARMAFFEEKIEDVLKLIRKYTLVLDMAAEGDHQADINGLAKDLSNASLKTTYLFFGVIDYLGLPKDISLSLAQKTKKPELENLLDKCETKQDYLKSFFVSDDRDIDNPTISQEAFLGRYLSLSTQKYAYTLVKKSHEACPAYLANIITEISVEDINGGDPEAFKNLLKFIAKKYPNIRTLNLNKKLKGRDIKSRRRIQAFAGALEDFENLEYLNLSYMRIGLGEKGLKKIKTIMSAISKIPNLKGLNLVGNNIGTPITHGKKQDPNGGKKIEALAKALAKLTQLEKLDLSENSLVDYEGVSSLMPSIGKLNQLKKLNLSNNSIGSGEKGDDKLTLLFTSLGALDKLHELGLSSCSLKGNNNNPNIITEMLVKALSGSTKLRDLDISWNEIQYSDTDGECIRKALPNTDILF